MSLFSKVRKGIKQRNAQRKLEKEERKQIDKEAKTEARQEYLAAYRKEKVEAIKVQARAKAKHDATQRGGNLGSLGGFAKGTMGMLGTAGKNFLDSDQFALPKSTPDFGFGGAIQPRKSKKRKFKTYNPLDDLI